MKRRPFNAKPSISYARYNPATKGNRKLFPAMFSLWFGFFGVTNWLFIMQPDWVMGSPFIIKLVISGVALQVPFWLPDLMIHLALHSIPSLIDGALVAPISALFY